MDFSSLENKIFNITLDASASLQAPCTHFVFDSPTKKKENMINEKNIENFKVNEKIANIMHSQSQTQASTLRSSSNGRLTKEKDKHEYQMPSKPTIPISPNLRSKSRSQSRSGSIKIMTSDEIEMLKLEESKRSERERVLKAKKLFQMNRMRLSSDATVEKVIRSTKEITIPSSPISHLTKRLGKKVQNRENDENSNANINDSHSMNSHGHSHSGPKSPTKPEPFSFETDKRASHHLAKSTESVSTFGESQSNFLKDARVISVSENACKKLTIASSPHFLTDKRSLSRPKPRPRSLEEIEAEIMEKCQAMQFKAKPVDKKALYGEPKFVSRPQTKPATEFKPFNLQTEKRAESNMHSNTSLEEDHLKSFKALPMPDFSSHPSNEGISHVAPKKLVIPMSPKLSGPNRASSAPANRQKPHHSIVEKQREEEKKFVPRKLNFELTEPKEFHLRSEERGQMYQLMQEEKKVLQERLLRESTSYHAKPVPAAVFAKPFQPQPSSRELTEVSEFRLESVHRHEDFAQRLAEQRARESEREAREREFTALPAPPSTHREKEAEKEGEFDLNLRELPLTVPREPVLETERRARERREFEQAVREREAARLEAESAREQELARAAAQELRAMRARSVAQGGLLFEARPVMTADAHPAHRVKPRALTEPITPVLLTKARAALRTKE